MSTYYAVVYDPKTGGCLSIPILAEDLNKAQSQARMLYGNNVRSVGLYA
jgi:hypothetical protein